MRLFLKKLFKRKAPLDKVIEAGHTLYWGTIDTNNPNLQDPHGCGFIDHLGNCIDVTGRSDIQKMDEKLCGHKGTCLCVVNEILSKTHER